MINLSPAHFNQNFNSRSVSAARKSGWNKKFWQVLKGGGSVKDANDNCDSNTTPPEKLNKQLSASTKRLAVGSVPEESPSKVKKLLNLTKLLSSK